MLGLGLSAPVRHRSRAVLPNYGQLYSKGFQRARTASVFVMLGTDPCMHGPLHAILT